MLATRRLFQQLQTNQLQVISIDCLAHIIHNMVIQSTKNYDNELMTKVRNIVKQIRYSFLRTSEFTKLQESFNLKRKLKLENVTRWSSKFDMIDRFIENKKVIILMQLLQQFELLPQQEISSKVWQNLEQLYKILQPFQLIMTHIQEGENPSISMQNPIVFNILDNILKINNSDSFEITQLKNTLQQEFVYRIQNNTQHQIYFKIASFLDPKFKDLYFLNDEQKKETHLFINQLIRQLKQQEEANQEETDDLNNNQKELGYKNKQEQSINNKRMACIFGEDYLYKSIKKLNISLKKENGSVLKTYLRDLDILQDEQDIFQWWYSKREKYPYLIKLAKTYLSGKITSSFSEKVFSKLGFIYNKRRQSLNSQMADKLIFLNNNYKLQSNIFINFISNIELKQILFVPALLICKAGDLPIFWFFFAKLILFYAMSKAILSLCQKEAYLNPLSTNTFRTEDQLTPTELEMVFKDQVFFQLLAFLIILVFYCGVINALFFILFQDINSLIKLANISFCGSQSYITSSLQRLGGFTNGFEFFFFLTHAFNGQKQIQYKRFKIAVWGLQIHWSLPPILKNGTVYSDIHHAPKQIGRHIKQRKHKVQNEIRGYR
ncbi:hypothetical protein ABPG72_013609 [Tetrahymena utriculariae]